MPSLRCVLLASSVLLEAQQVSAESSPAAHREMRLSWVRSAAAASCPDAGHVEADVERRLGWSPFIRGAASTESIEAVVDRENDVWRAVIELRAADGSSLGSRNVESPASNCASLAAAAGLAIALMIEPLLPPESRVPPVVAAPPPVPKQPAPSAAPGARGDSGAEAEGIEALHRARAWRSAGSVSLGAFGVAGVLPRFALGPTLAGNLRVAGGLYFVASGSLLPEQHVARDGAEVGFGMTLGSAGPCYRVPLAARLSLSSCASFLVGSMQVIVSNPEPVAPGSRLWWAASTGLRLGWSAGRLEAALGLDAIGHFKRENYRLEGPGGAGSASFFVEPAVAVAGSLLVGVRFDR